tara:strand:- start:154 stop:426 length:273 start_codon:yes stop_codon:yes gene_type:complete
MSKEKSTDVHDKDAEKQDELMEDISIGVDPDTYLAGIIAEVKGLSLSSKRRICKEAAVDCRLYAQHAKIRGDRQDTKAWFNLAWTLSKLR